MRHEARLCPKWLGWSPNREPKPADSLAPICLLTRLPHVPKLFLKYLLLTPDIKHRQFHARQHRHTVSMESTGSRIFLWAYPISLCLVFIISRTSSALKVQSGSLSYDEGARKALSPVFRALHFVFCCSIVRTVAIVHAVQITYIENFKAITLILTAFTQSIGWYSSKEFGVIIQFRCVVHTSSDI